VQGNIVKIHFHIILKVVETLDQIFNENRYADKVLEKTFKAHRQLGSRDRKFFAETVYEVVRHNRYYAEVMKSEENFDLVVAHLIRHNGELPAWEEFSGFDVEKIKSRLKYKHEDKILYSFPDWLDELGRKEFGVEWPALMKALNQPAKVYLRTNTLKITREQLKEEFAKEEIGRAYV
jgi:16S rRNA (cytosine967-C5)-methyltransferase